MEASSDDLLWNVVPTPQNSLSHPGECKLHARKRKKEDMNLIACGFETAKKRQVSSARQCRLKCKGHALIGKRAHFIEHHSSRSESCRLRGERRDRLCHEISIHEVVTVRVFRQEFVRKRSLASPFGPAMT